MILKNRLAESQSPYLREASGQPVNWQVYSEEVFMVAKELDRPILLDIGAVWCHWCHVMDNESYNDNDVAAIINEKFVPVKVDRDQMPDVDSRYQAAVGALTGTGGWPLTGFLTPEGKVFFGGTYFPKDDTGGRSGLMSLLPQIADAYSARREEVLQSAEEVFEQIREYERRASIGGSIGEEIITAIVEDAGRRFDEKFGGFGRAPKFFNPTALRLLVEEFRRTHDASIERMAVTTLDAIARGGVRDLIGGGFHRYSVDRYWHVPHFEKMLYDNALMLSLYSLASETWNTPLYMETATQTADWIAGAMSDSGSAFFAHQDADVSPGDDGSYWTWTLGEIEELLSSDERNVAEQYFDIRPEPNDIHGFPERNVLRVAMSVEDAASGAGKSPDEAVALIHSAVRKLREARNRRKAPFTDKTIFSDRNGLAISALVETSIVLKTPKYLDAAERAADFTLDNMTGPAGMVAHSMTEGKLTYGRLIDDQVCMGIALLDLFDVMRNDSHLAAAEKIAEVLIGGFADPAAGGFFDRPKSGDAAGMLSSRRKPIEDTPTPSGNSNASIFLDRLFSVTENRRYYDVADRTLKAFAGSVPKLGIFAANYGRALRLHLTLSKTVR